MGQRARRRGTRVVNAAEATADAWIVYLIECAGERLYAGITNDLPA